MMSRAYTKIVAMIALLTATTYNCDAQLRAPEDLKRCLSIGLASNYELQIVHGEQQQATTSAAITNSGFLPTIDLDASYDFYKDNMAVAVRESGERYSYEENDHTIDVGVDLSWTLFDGFSVRTNYKKLRELEKQSRVSTRIAVENYIADLTAEYYNYIQQQSRLKILNMAVDLSKERLRIVRARYVVGNFSRLDYQQAQVDFNVDSADYIKQREVLKSSSIRLNEMMANSNFDEPLNIQDSVIRLDRTLDYDDLLVATEESNAHLIYANLDSKVAKLDYKKILARNYPSVSMSTGYGFTRNIYSRATNAHTNDLGFQAGFDVSFTIFDTTRKTERKNASIAIKNAELNVENVKLQLRSEFSDLWQAYINNLGLLNLERNNLVSAKLNYEIAMERYMLGNLSGIEMREAQISLLDAEDRILEATYNTKLCEISLLLLSGRITNYLI